MTRGPSLSCSCSVPATEARQAVLPHSYETQPVSVLLPSHAVRDVGPGPWGPKPPDSRALREGAPHTGPGPSAATSSRVGSPGGVGLAPEDEDGRFPGHKAQSTKPSSVTPRRASPLISEPLTRHTPRQGPASTGLEGGTNSDQRGLRGSRGPMKSQVHNHSSEDAADSEVDSDASL